MAANGVYEFCQGDSPLLVSMPHVGTRVPAVIRDQMTSEAYYLPDTDWEVHRLYDFLPELGVSTIRANYSRYVIDLNRSAKGDSLYPGKSVTELCPTTLFSGAPVYRPGYSMSKGEVARRIRQYWQPYHAQLKAEIAHIKSRFGYALLWDAHSIQSRVPRFFDGNLPDFNWGTADEQSCDPVLTQLLFNTSMASGQYTCVANGRFKGGFITRDNGAPDQGVHAVQLELSQATYMSDEKHYLYSEKKAERLKQCLRVLIGEMLDYKPQLLR